MMEPPTDIDVTDKARVLLEALPYIQRFRGTTFVIKYGGSFMDDPDPVIRAQVATDLTFLASVGINVVVVHGGGKAISRAMTASGAEPVFKQGMRVTDKATAKIVEKTLNKGVNTDICELIQANRGMPQPMAGNSIFVCDKHISRDANGQAVDLGFVGQIHTVKAKLIKKALQDGKIPVISPIAVDERGQVYNTNADVAAAAVAATLRARRLVFLCDVPGLMRDPAEPASLISTLHVNKVADLKADGTISSGMLPKVDSAVRALEAGVHRVHFVYGRQPHSLLLEIFTDKGVGTEIVNE
jgi:acetylglutamate kinase